MFLIAVLLMVGDTMRARRRVLDYCERAGLKVRRLQMSFSHNSGPFSPYRGKHIFRGTLERDGIPEEFPAWFSSAGLVSITSDEPLEVIFSR